MDLYTEALIISMLIIGSKFFSVYRCRRWGRALQKRHKQGYFPHKESRYQRSPKQLNFKTDIGNKYYRKYTFAIIFVNNKIYFALKNLEEGIIFQRYFSLYLKRREITYTHTHIHTHLTNFTIYNHTGKKKTLFLLCFSLGSLESLRKQDC